MGKAWCLYAPLSLIRRAPVCKNRNRPDRQCVGILKNAEVPSDEGIKLELRSLERIESENISFNSGEAGALN